MATTSGTSRIWGPNGLAGWALGALGGRESAAVRKKLAFVQCFFPHKDNSAVTNIADLYHDALEFIRPSLYRDSVRRSVMDLLLEQIKSRELHYLKKALGSRTRLDVQDFLSAIMSTTMNDIEKIYDNLYRKEKRAVLSTSCKEAQTLVSVLFLIDQLATESDTMCKTILKAGILDVILRVYVIFPAFSRAVIDGAEHWSALKNACGSILLTLFSSEPNHKEVLEHPVCALWTGCNPLPPTYTELPLAPDEIPLERCTSWRRAPPLCVKRRLIMIYVDNLWKSNVNLTEDMEACADIVEFTRSQFYDTEIVDIAFLAILKHILVSGDQAQHLIKAIERCSDEDIVLIFSRIIRLWFECVTTQVQENLMYDEYLQPAPLRSQPGSTGTFSLPIHIDQSFYSQEKSRLFRRTSNVDIASYNITKFATTAAHHSANIRTGMLNAGALSLVLIAFTNVDFQLVGLMDGSKGNKKKREVPSRRGESSQSAHLAALPFPLDAIEAEASTLTILIHTAAFRRSWTDESFDMRRHLCSMFVDSLLEEHGVITGRYVWTRALFTKILA